MITLQDFSKSYGKSTIIDQCSFAIPDNRVTFFMGPNGAGKTTLIKCLAGLEDYVGSIFVDDKPIEKYRSDMLVVWDDCPFYNNMSGLKNLMIMTEKKLKASDIITIAEKYLTRDLLKRRVKTYSYGQRKKLALALQEILKPKILVMDEISNGLDFDMMKQLRKDVAKISEGKTVILTGHQFSFYEGLANEVFIVKDGSIENVTEEYNGEKGSLETIYERYFD